MEAGTLTRAQPLSHWRATARWADRNPGQAALAVIGVIALLLIATQGLHDFGQRTVNGLVSGSYIALGAVGLTLVYGILKLVNFAHGDMLTFGAYIAFLANVTWDLPLPLALAIGAVATAVIGVLFEVTMWRPVRAKGAGLFQLLLMSIGLAFVLRNGIQLFAGSEQRSFDVDLTNTVEFMDLRIGNTELAAVITGLVVLVAVASLLRYSSLGRQMRALSDNFDLAETTGIDTGRIVIFTWILAGALAGLAGGLLTASTGVLTPNSGFFVLLSLFAAVILGGIGNAYGALAGGLVLGLAQEWSTLLFEARWKGLVGFGVLIVVLVIRPQGIFGRERTLG